MTPVELWNRAAAPAVVFTVTAFRSLYDVYFSGMELLRDFMCNKTILELRTRRWLYIQMYFS